MRSKVKLKLLSNIVNESIMRHNKFTKENAIKNSRRNPIKNEVGFQVQAKGSHTKKELEGSKERGFEIQTISNCKSCHSSNI